MTPKEIETLKAQGFNITTKDDPDLLDSMLAKYLDSNPDLAKGTPASKKALSSIKSFIDFVKGRLIDNPPITMTFLDRGLALQFADYTRIVLVDTSTVDTTRTASVSITDSDRKGGPVVFRQVDTSVPINR
jgi:hypothetical protein